MASSIDIVNRALDKLGESKINTIDDNTERARVMKRAYDRVREAELRAHPWNFAKRRALLPADADAPAFGFDYAYTFPADCLRVLPGVEDDWTIEGRKILTDTAAPLQVRYIANLVETGDFDALFVEVFACRLAVECAEKITQSSAKREQAKDEYARALVEARKANAFEEKAQEMPVDTWLLARY